MDLLEGENLEVRRQRKGGVLEASEVLSLTDDVLDTLMAAHDKGVIHRDIKPENLFVTLENSVRLLDFGIARINVPENPGQTLAGVSMGTPAFMPPEQASAHWDKVDVQSDLWALGASMFTLLTGRYVHQGGTVNESLVLAVTKAAPKLENIDPSLPEVVTTIVNKALERDKTKRYKTAAEMQFQVRMAYRLLQGEVSDDERYSLTDGKLGFHSAPPGPVAPLAFGLSTPASLPRGRMSSIPFLSDPFSSDQSSSLELESVTGEPLSSDMRAFGTDHKRKRVVVGAVALMGLLGVVLTLVLWVNDESKSARPSKLGASETTASGAAPVKSIGWDDIKEQMNQPVPEPNQPTEVADLDEVATDAGSELSTKGDGTRSRARRSGSRAGHVAPAAPKASPAPKPTALPEKDFDPFEKRH
jgi:serine/threonine-protein kinase